MFETSLHVVADRREPVDVFRERDLGGANAPVRCPELLHVDRVDASRLIEVWGRAIAALFSRRSGFLVGLEVPVPSLEKHAVTERPGVAKVVAIAPGIDCWRLPPGRRWDRRCRCKTARRGAR